MRYNCQTGRIYNKKALSSPWSGEIKFAQGRANPICETYKEVGSDVTKVQASPCSCKGCYYSIVRQLLFESWFWVDTLMSPNCNTMCQYKTILKQQLT